MTHAWKKRYSFRLQEEDKELANFLEQVPNTQTSKVIREMLRFAYKRMKQEQAEQKQFEKLIKEIRSLRESQEKSTEIILEHLSNLDVPASLSNSNSEEQTEEQLEDEKVKETAQAILESFGV